MTTYHAKCAKCDVALQEPPDPEPKSVFSCPNCGAGDSLENVEREIGEYMAEKIGGSLGRRLDAVARKSQLITITHQQGPQKNYRFVIDFEPH